MWNMKKYFFLILIISCFRPTIASTLDNNNQNFLLNKSTNENPVKKIIKKLAKANVYDATTYNENEKVISEQETLYRELLNSASPDQLTELATNNKNAVVRLYAFRALMEKVKNASISVYNQFKNDTTAIKVINGQTTEMKPLNTISNGFLY
jgi:predicted aminopeptidase